MSTMIPSASDVEATLRVLVGLPLRYIRRAIDMQVFQFGEVMHGRSRSSDEQTDFGRYALHVQCAWRWLSRDRLVVGSHDRFIPRDNPDHVPDDFDWTEPKSNLCDARTEELIHSHENELLIVRGISAGRCGAFSLAFSNGDVLEVFPDNSTSELWRFFDHATKGGPPHYVFTMDAAFSEWGDEP